MADDSRGPEWEETRTRGDETPEPIPGQEDVSGPAASSTEDPADLNPPALDGSDWTEEDDDLLAAGEEWTGEENDLEESSGEREDDARDAVPPDPRERLRQATGALPKGIVPRLGVALAVILGTLVFLTVSRREAARAPADPELARRQEAVESAAVPTSDSLADATSAVTEAIQEDRAAREAATQRQIEELEARTRAAQEALLRQQVGLDAGPSPVPPRPAGSLGLTTETEAIEQWREQQRIEELQREARAPWTSALALDLTPPPEEASAAAAEAVSSEGAQILEAAASTRSELEQLRSSLLAQELGQPQAGSGPVALPDPAVAVPETPPLAVPGDRASPSTLREGSLLPAVLTTALDSRSPGPVVAMISRPVHSRDRLRILIPRGTRVLGSFSVGNRRLLVDFHKLQFADGRSVSLGMRGLDRAGRAGLATDVRMHYAQRLGAVGLIGMLTAIPQAIVGRSSRGSGYGLQGMSTVGTQVATVGTQALDPMMARPPTVRVRPGTAVRIYLQSDLDIPGGTP